MVAILTVRDAEKKHEICRKAHVPYDEALHIIASYEDDILTHSAIFRIHGDEGSVLWIDAAEDDFTVSAGLGKAVLNIMDLRGVRRVTMPLTLERFAAPLRFQKTDDGFEVDLNGYFACGCCKE